MPGFENVFQRMDETIVDVCLRELDWDKSALAWTDGSRESGPARLTEMYRLARPLILHLVKADKSPVKNMKKLSISRSMLDAGKKNMENNNFYDALNMFNKAVVFAPNIDDNLGKACAERAACLLRLGDYKRALVDIEQAEQCEYQFERRYELEERKGLAYLGLRLLELARTAFTEAISLLEDAAGFLHRKFVERKMQELRQNLNSCCTFAGDTEPPSIFRSMRLLADLKGRNKRYPALSDKADIAPSSASHSRQMFTAAEVSAGDILGVEKPIAAVLEKDFIRTNCWHCLTTVKAPYGCPLCSAVKFCSRECLTEACQTYHPSECLLTDIILSNRIDMWHIALRAVSSRPLKQNLLVGRNGMSPIYSSGDLNTLLNLDVPQHNKSTEEVKKRTLMAVFYLIILQMTGYFDNSSGGGGGGEGTGARLNPSLSSIQQMKGKANDSSLSDAELHIAILLDLIILAAPYCTTEVCHFQLASEAEWTGGKVTTVIGRTINPTLALVRHSCYPTAARVCYANQTLLIAQKNMRAGEPITINYSAPFYAASRNERKDHLYAGYVLNCECEACRADWPLFDSLPPGPAGLGDQEVNIAGVRPMMNQNPALHQHGLTQTEAGVMDTFNRVKGKLDQLQRTNTPGSPPSKVMIQNQVRLFRCLLAMYSSKLYIIKMEFGSLPIPV